MPIEHFPLTPIIHPWLKDHIARPERLLQYMDQHGSPVNLHHLTPFTENILEYQRVFEKYTLNYRIYFARKANKCLAFATQAATLNQGVDTASLRELEECLAAGVSPEKLLLTAAVKNERLLTLAIKNDVTIVADNQDELDHIQKIAESLHKKPVINIRLGGFIVRGKPLTSRFGFTPAQAAKLIMELQRTHPHLLYQGLHFHLNGYSIEQRVCAIEQCVALIDELNKYGISTVSLDIGGGFLINYLASETEWHDFHQALRDAILENRPAITYANDPLGIIRIENKLHGEPQVYPYFNSIHKAAFLEKILTAKSEIFGTPIYQMLRDRQIEIRMEPGRSLLDQAGCTIAKVTFRKQDTQGNLLIGLEMNRTQLRSSSADFLLDPIHITQNNTAETAGKNEYHGYLVGAYCLEQEFILKRKLKFEQYPSVGDLFIFLNTAGYMMHFFESEAHLFHLAENIIEGL